MAGVDVRIPLIVYALVMTGALAMLSWDASLVRKSETAVLALERNKPKSLGELFQERSEPVLASQAVTRAKARAVWHFRFTALLFLAFPTSVIFPTLLSSSRPEPPRKRRVVNIHEMTFDDVGKGFPDTSPAATPRKRLMTINMSALLAFIVALAVYGLIWGDLYGGLRNGSLLALVCSMGFVASALAFPLRDRVQESRQVGVILGAGYLIVAGLAWLFG